MKLSSINLAKVQQYSKTNNKNSEKRNGELTKTNNPGFTGAADALVSFWHFVDAGGRALQFTVEDMFGTNIWRTVKGLFAGIKFTHKLNFLAAIQEGVREFLTGPLMCVMPIAILSAAVKLTGKTANTHVENIENLSYLAKNVESGTKEAFDDKFFTTVVEDMLKTTTGTKEVDSKDVKELVGQMHKLKSTTNKKESKKILSGLQLSFENIVKRSKKSFKDTNFIQAKYSISKDKTGATKFKNYIEYVSAYAEDFAKKYAKEGTDGLTSQNIDAFKTNRIGKRILTFSSMFFITLITMAQIPKIYTKLSGSVNPNASAIYNEAKNENNKKEVK